MKPDEQKFLLEVYEQCRCSYDQHIQEGNWPRDIINSPGFLMHYKRAWYLLEKWCRKDWYEYGVTLDLGWLTPRGIEKAKELLRAEQVN